jgi:hypothetical protein
MSVLWSVYQCDCCEEIESAHAANGLPSGWTVLQLAQLGVTRLLCAECASAVLEAIKPPEAVPARKKHEPVFIAGPNVIRCKNCGKELGTFDSDGHQKLISTWPNEECP